MKKHAPVHPGEVLREDFLLPLGLSEYRLAQDIGVPPRRINEIVIGKRASPPTPPCACPATSHGLRRSG